MKQNILLELGERSYDIVVGSDLLGDSACFQGGPSVRSAHACIVSNSTVLPIHGASLRSVVAELHVKVSEFCWPDGEQHKTLAQLDHLFTHLLEAQADRKTILYALGGGVVGDMAGFAAACFQRGIKFVQIPTTLLSQVDSSVGGKTGVNHPLGKNMIGAFYQPTRVVCDVATLLTLPAREFNSGLAEVIKYGAIADLPFFEWLERQMEALILRDQGVLIETVARCCRIKADVVAKDEREAGLREILNFGHTFGHAIETGLGYGKWLHGEAVAAGMVMAAELSVSVGLMAKADATRLCALIERAHLPTLGPSEMPAASYLPLMRVDKKARAGEIRYVLVDGLGRARTQTASDDDVMAAITRCLPVA